MKEKGAFVLRLLCRNVLAKHFSPHRLAVKIRHRNVVLGLKKNVFVMVVAAQGEVVLILGTLANAIAHETVILSAPLLASGKASNSIEARGNRLD